MIAAIQHVPVGDRPRNVAALSHALQGWAQDVNVIEDVKRYGPQYSWREALRSAGGERLLTLQDDVTITAPLSVLDDLVALRPDDILCLCYPRAAGAEMADKGYRWVKLRGMWVYGVIYPPGMAKDVLTWAEKHIPLEYRHDDRTLSAYLNHHALFAYGPIPSVVQHLEFASTLGHGRLPQKRAAHAVWSPEIDYADLRSFPHASKRWTVVDIKKALKP